MKAKRSPLFYVGDKYKLIPQLLEHFPKKINRFIEPFTGGGSVFLNIEANKFLLNDIDTNIYKIHDFLMSQSENKEEFFSTILLKAKKYNLSRSFHEDIVPIELKREWKKTYYAKFNKTGYYKLREDYNENKEILDLYLLLIYGFNRMLRFNSKNKFNVPVGNVDFNSNVYNSLENYFDFINNNNIYWHNKDYKDFLGCIEFKENDFIYLDPPYLISSSEYNKIWDDNKEIELLNTLDSINKKNIKFAISNIIYHKNNKNEIFKSWMGKYDYNYINSNYISYHDNTIKKTIEVLVKNY